MAADAELSRLGDGAHRIGWHGRAAFAKVRRNAPPDFFGAEQRGLQVLREAGALRVPDVFAATPTHIVVEDLGTGRPCARDWENGGRGLARLHRNAGAQFGFDADGYCGDTPQANARHADDHEFFAACRLRPQAQRAIVRGLLTRDDARKIESLCGRLSELLPEAPPVLIHGDLWTGNLHACANGELALIDGGAVHYGWAECDLAMLILFGEPPRAFFAAYESEARIDSGWRERAPLLNLYHLLNHLNLFGGTYLGAVRAVLARYA